MSFSKLLHSQAILPFFIICTLAHAADPVVSNITAVQRVGTKLVDISYNVTADTTTVQIDLKISNNGGQTFTVPAVSTSGAVGAGIPTGANKTITWNAGVDWNGFNASQLRFKVIADDLLLDSTQFALIPAGSFTMGRTSGDTDTNAPSVTVNVSAFYMGRHEVHMGLWDEVRTWGVANGYTDLLAGASRGWIYPAQKIRWLDVIKWCNARSQKEGLTPCYTVSGAVMKTGFTVPTANWIANGYRLPTEAEWEKAARGGVSGKRFPWGMDTISHSQANFFNSGQETYRSGTIDSHPSFAYGSAPYTSPVGGAGGMFAANDYGLYDMAGNASEWCWDLYGESTYVTGATNPRGAVTGSSRVVRGGSWNMTATSCRAAYRDSKDPWYSSNYIGFRVARSLVP
jgi:sulfatase modifying factor 1